MDLMHILDNMLDWFVLTLANRSPRCITFFVVARHIFRVLIISLVQRFGSGHGSSATPSNKGRMAASVRPSSCGISVSIALRSCRTADKTALNLGDEQPSNMSPF